MPIVIKSGRKVFFAVCPFCGCEFSYKFSEITRFIDEAYVECPECSHPCEHPMQIAEKTVGGVANEEDQLDL